MQLERSIHNNCFIAHRYNIHQHSTDDGGQAMGGELRHVQMGSWSKHILGEGSEQKGRKAESNAIRNTTFHYNNK